MAARRPGPHVSTTVVSTALAVGPLYPRPLTFRSRGGESGRVFTSIASPLLDPLALASSLRKPICSGLDTLSFTPQVRKRG